MTGAGFPRAVALLGDPVAHSLSPILHEAAFRALGLDARYVAIRTLPGELPHLMRAFARSGGGNVTVPHKVAARGALDHETAAVVLTGACNCFWADESEEEGDDGGDLAGDNTDVGGFLAALDAWPDGPELAGGRVLLLGAGGGARAVAAACLKAGVHRLAIRNRTTRRAEELAERFGGRGTEVTALAYEDGALPVPEERYDLVVNATSLGLDEGDPLPLELGGLDVRAAFDLVYGADGTSWVRHARREGVPATDGLEMLIRQAALSLERWFGVEAPLDAMRRAAEHRLGR